MGFGFLLLLVSLVLFGFRFGFRFCRGGFGFGFRLDLHLVLGGGCVAEIDALLFALEFGFVGGDGVGVWFVVCFGVFFRALSFLGLFLCLVAALYVLDLRLLLFLLLDRCHRLRQLLLNHITNKKPATDEIHEPISPRNLSSPSDFCPPLLLFLHFLAFPVQSSKHALQSRKPKVLRPLTPHFRTEPEIVIFEEDANVRLRGSGEVLCVRGILGSERVAGFPALVREDAMAEAGGIVGPGGVLGVIGDARAAGECKG